MNDVRVHPWHRINLSIADRRVLRGLEQRLSHQYPDVPAGRIIRMVYGTARLLHSVGPLQGQLVDQVEAACHAALAEDDMWQPSIRCERDERRG